MGTTRLEEPLNRYSVTAAVHGHAHRGTPEGRTSAGIPVYNVSLPLLRRAFPERPPFRLIELRVGVPPDGRAGMAPGQTTEPDIQLDDKPATERDEARTATTSTAT